MGDQDSSAAYLIPIEDSFHGTFAIENETFQSCHLILPNSLGALTSENPVLCPDLNFGVLDPAKEQSRNKFFV